MQLPRRACIAVAQTFHCTDIPVNNTPGPSALRAAHSMSGGMISEDDIARHVKERRQYFHDNAQYVTPAGQQAGSMQHTGPQTPLLRAGA